jgi:hypothetical protein
MTGHVHHVVNSAHNPEITALVASGAVAGKINVRNFRPVLFYIAFVIAPYCAKHRGKRMFNDQITAFVRADRFSGFGNNIEKNSGKRARRRAGNRRRRAGQRGNHYPPVSVCHHVSTIGQRPLPMIL